MSRGNADQGYTNWDIQSEGFSCELEEIQAGGIALAKAVLFAQRYFRELA